jgi:hypothetical protein
MYLNALDGVASSNRYFCKIKLQIPGSSLQLADENVFIHDVLQSTLYRVEPCSYEQVLDLLSSLLTGDLASDMPVSRCVIDSSFETLLSTNESL